MTALLLAALVAAGVLGVRAARRRTGRTGSAGAVLLVVAALLGAQAAIGSPVFAQEPGLAQVPGLDDCKDAPNPERPGAGLVGALDPSPADAGTPESPYREVGYAGLVWHTYDLGCGPSGIRNPDAVIDTWAGNQLFNVGKAVVGASNGLHYTLADQGLLEPLDDLIVSGTVALYDSVFAPWFGLVAILLAIVMFRSIWRGDLAGVSRRALWALAGLWLAAATYLTPLLYTQVLDEVLVAGSDQIRTGFLQEVGIEERDALPTLLHDQIVYRNWLRGEFGSPDGPQATELGRDLLRAQAYTKEEVAAGADAEGSAVADAKKAAYEEIAGRTGSAYGYFQGVDGNRIGAGFLALLQSLMFALFQLLAQTALLLAQVLLRVVILLGPVIGLVAILYSEVLRGVGRAVGAALLNVVVLSALAALHTLVMVWVFDPARGLPVLPQMVLAGLITVVLLLVARPVRRMWQMVELSVGAVGGALPSAPPGVLARFRRTPDTGPTAAERFWEETRGTDPDAPHAPRPGSGVRARPEGSVVPVVTAVAERLDRTAPPPPSDGTLPAGEPDRALPPGGDGPRPLAAGPDGGVPQLAPAAGGPTPALPVARPPLAPARRAPAGGTDGVLVPSQRARPGPPTPEPAELEVVAGRPVFVVYRPSVGLVPGDPGSRSG